MNSRFYSSIAAVTNLQVTAAPSDTSIQVASSVGWPSSFPFILALDYGAANEELVLVTAGGPSVFTVTRAYDGTSASTHNAGAVVRHTSSAIDFTDSRTHEASTSGVHGITGSFVDTASSQTLNNKTLNAAVLNNGTLTGTLTATGATIDGATLTTTTLTSPTVNGAALSGTLSGTPTFSGAPTFSAGASVSGAAVRIARTSTTDTAIQTSATADTSPRFVTTAGGTLSWGDGTGATDTSLARSGVGQLSVTGSLSASTNLTAGGTLTGGLLSISGTSWTTFTPVYTGIGSATFSINEGWYTKIGKIVFFEIYTVWGSDGTGTSGVQVQFPTTPYRASNNRQAITAYILGSNGGVIDGQGVLYSFASDSGTTGATIRRFDGITTQGNNYTGPSNPNGGPTIVTIQGWYREA